MRIVVDEMPKEPDGCPWCLDNSCMDYTEYICTFKNSKRNCWYTSECPYFVGFKDMPKNDIKEESKREIDK